VLAGKVFQNFHGVLLHKSTAAAGHLGGLVVGLVNLQEADLRQQLLAMGGQVGQAVGVNLPANTTDSFLQLGALDQATSGELSVAGDQLISVEGTTMVHQKGVALKGIVAEVADEELAVAAAGSFSTANLSDSGQSQVYHENPPMGQIMIKLPGNQRLLLILAVFKADEPVAKLAQDEAHRGQLILASKVRHMNLKDVHENLPDRVEPVDAHSKAGLPHAKAATIGDIKLLEPAARERGGVQLLASVGLDGPAGVDMTSLAHVNSQLQHTLHVLMALQALMRPGAHEGGTILRDNLNGLFTLLLNEQLGIQSGRAWRHNVF
jgi:hypothetical protein